MSNTYNTSLGSFFNDFILDNNSKAVCDLNSGLMLLFKNLNEKSIYWQEIENYLVTESEANLPDILAKNSTLGDTKYWWWVMLTNGLEDPLEDIKSNWVYSILSENTINTFINELSTVSTVTDDSRIGKVVELN